MAKLTLKEWGHLSGVGSAGVQHSLSDCGIDWVPARNKAGVNWEVHCLGSEAGLTLSKLLKSPAFLDGSELGVEKA